MQNIKMDIQLDKIFRKQYKKAHENIQTAFKERVRLFSENQHHVLLHNHLLTGKYRGHRSINITGDWRAIYIERETTDKKIHIKFKLFGTHSQLYR